MYKTAGTQTPSSAASLFNSMINGVFSGTSSRKRKARQVKTVVRMRGYPSARVRAVRPATHAHPSSRSTRIMKVNHPTPKKNVKPKVDNKGIIILHHPSPVKVNYGLPRGVDKAKTKIDNKGIDIHKWRYSMLSLRDIVDPYDKVESGGKLSENLKQDIREGLRRKMSQTRPVKEMGIQVENEPFEQSQPPPRRFSFASSGRQSPSRFSIRSENFHQEEKAWHDTNEEEGKRKLSQEFMASVKRKLEMKLKESETPPNETKLRPRRPSQSFMAQLKRKLEMKLRQQSADSGNYST